MFFLASGDNKDEEVDYADQAYRSMKRWRIAKIVVFLLAIFFFLFHFFLYWDPGEGCFIGIKPAFLEFTNLDMKRALEALEQASPEDYKMVCGNVGVVNPFIACGGFGGGCYYEGQAKASTSGEIYVSTAKDDLIMAMAVTVHETCHAVQAKEGRPLNEEECYQVDDKLLRKVVTFQE